MLTWDDLKPEQIEDIDYLVENPANEGFAVLPVGYGKTIVTLAAITSIEAGEQRKIRTLVVSTKKIVELTWGKEIESWSFTRHLSYAAATGKNFRKAVLSNPDVLGVNFENLERYYDMVDKGEVELPDVLVIDESSKMKAHDAKRVKRHCGFGLASTPRGYVHRFRYRFALSATPTAEGYAKIWPQECAISRQRRLGKNITTFRAQYCTARWNGNAMVYEVGEEAKKRIHADLHDILITSRKDKYLDLPDPVYSKLVVPWTDAEYERYRKMEDDAILRLSELDGNADILAPNIGVQLNKLRQMASGFVYEGQIGEDGKVRQKTHWFDSRLDKLSALGLVIDAADDVPVVVFTQFQAEMELLAQAYPQAQIGLPETLDDWNARKIPLMVLHPRSAGHGINLQYGSHIGVWYSLPWSYEEWHQANGRLHRTGQTQQVSIIRLERERSVELDVWLKLQNKGRTLKQFIDNIRARRGG